MKTEDIPTPWTDAMKKVACYGFLPEAEVCGVEDVQKLERDLIKAIRLLQSIKHIPGVSDDILVAIHNSKLL